MEVEEACLFASAMIRTIKCGFARISDALLVSSGAGSNNAAAMPIPRGRNSYSMDARLDRHTSIGIRAFGIGRYVQNVHHGTNLQPISILPFARNQREKSLSDLDLDLLLYVQ